jgi:hypothetical protein
MATGVNFTIFEKRSPFWIQRCITCNNSLHKNGQKKMFNFNSKINKQLSLKTVSIINLFIYYKNALFKWNRVDRSSIWWLDMVIGDEAVLKWWHFWWHTKNETVIMWYSVELEKDTLYHEIGPCCHLKRFKLALCLENKWRY